MSSIIIVGTGFFIWHICLIMNDFYFYFTKLNSYFIFKFILKHHRYIYFTIIFFSCDYISRGREGFSGVRKSIQTLFFYDHSRERGIAPSKKLPPLRPLKKIILHPPPLLRKLFTRKNTFIKL